ALGGGLVAGAAREALLSAPRVDAWLREALLPLGRAGREGYAPSADEQRRLGLIGGVAIAAIATLIAGPGPLALAAAAGPWCVGALVGRRRERYRRAVERAIPEIAAAIADAISGARATGGALPAAGGSRGGPPAAGLARAAAAREPGASTGGGPAAMRARLHSDRVDSLCMALLSQQLAGGDVASLMRRLAAGAAERDRVADEARVATAQARFTGLLVVALPAGAALFAELLE